MYFVYITTNNLNGKRYAGFSSSTKKNADSYLGSGKHLNRAIKKYGRENFSRTIIREFETSAEAIAFEREFITENSCHTSSEWYNIALGYTTQGFKGKKHSKESKSKIAEYSRKRKSTNKMKENMYTISQLPKTEKQIQACRNNGKNNGSRNRKPKEVSSYICPTCSKQNEILEFIHKPRKERHFCNQTCIGNYAASKNPTIRKIKIDNDTFASVLEASRKLNLTPDQIRYRLSLDKYPNFKYLACH